MQKNIVFTTMTVHGKAVPNIVGVDIGCGMYTVNIGKVDIDFEKVDEAAHYIPSGMNVWQGRQERFNLQELACYRSLSNTKYLERSLGTLGGGNHFIEIDKAADGTKYIVIHTGSRNLGKQVAEIYQHLAVSLHSGKEEYFKKRDEIIATYKAEGRRKEIHAAGLCGRLPLLPYLYSLKAPLQFFRGFFLQTAGKSLHHAGNHQNKCHKDSTSHLV